jgi:hypothetical protein
MPRESDFPEICSKCRKQLGARFVIVHYTADAKVRIRVKLCSLACVIGWAAGYGIDLGRQAVGYMLKSLPKTLPTQRKARRFRDSSDS